MYSARRSDASGTCGSEPCSMPYRSARRKKKPDWMTIRPYTVLSAAMSVDGCLDDTGSERLMLSNSEDFDRVDELRASCYAILIGAGTLRKDDPQLLVNSARRRAERSAADRSEYPLKVTVTGSGKLDAGLRFWRNGGAKLVFTVDFADMAARDSIGNLADVVSTGPRIDWGAVLDELGCRGVGRLMVEGGGVIHTQLMELDLVDEVQLAVAPLRVRRADAPKFLGSADHPGGPAARMRLLVSRVIGDMVLLRYAPKERS